MSRPVALVTGARRGIGRAIGIALAKVGYDLAFTDIVEDEAKQEAIRLFTEAGAKACFFKHDVAALESHSGLIKAVISAFGRLDLFVSNAGIGAPVRGDILEITPESFDVVMDVNLRGAAFLSQEVAKALMQRSSGRPAIVFITSASTDWSRSTGPNTVFQNSACPCGRRRSRFDSHRKVFRSLRSGQG